MYSDLNNTKLGALPLVPGKTIPRGNPVLELRRAMRNGQPVWVKNGRSRKRMLRVEHGKATSTVDPGRGPVPIALYDTALTSAAYGNGVLHLGDLFNDVMGAVVPGWDKRPDWMKKIQVKPDPVKFIQAAQKFVPPSQIQKILGIGQQYGVTPYYGGVPISPEGGAMAWQYGDLGAGLAQIPTWVYLAGGGLVLLLIVGSRSR